MIVALYDRPLVVVDARSAGKLKGSCLSDSCHNGYAKFHRLSASVGDHLFLLTSDRSLVRYSWQDIESGIYDKSDKALTRVADFSVHNNEVVVLLANGGLATISDSQTIIHAGVTIIGVDKWCCVVKTSDWWLCAGLAGVNEGRLVVCGGSGEQIVDTMEVKLTPNDNTKESRLV